MAAEFRARADDPAMIDAATFPALARQVGILLRERGLTIALAESSLGGLMSSWLTSIPGSSAFFRGSVVAYDNAAKVKLLGVSAESLAAFGAVSEAVAAEMATGVRLAFEADLALAETGITGPSGATGSKPLGLFYLAFATARGVTVSQHRLAGDRLKIRHQAGLAALEWLSHYLLHPPL